MFESNKVYKNRYGDEYQWDPVGKGYIFNMKGNSMDYCRMGGKVGQEGVHTNDLGMFDPSGGPYVELGTKIDGKAITKISIYGGKGFIVEVE